MTRAGIELGTCFMREHASGCLKKVQGFLPLMGIQRRPIGHSSTGLGSRSVCLTFSHFVIKIPTFELSGKTLLCLRTWGGFFNPAPLPNYSSGLKKKAPAQIPPVRI